MFSRTCDFGISPGNQISDFWFFEQLVKVPNSHLGKMLWVSFRSVCSAGKNKKIAARVDPQRWKLCPGMVATVATDGAYGLPAKKKIKLRFGWDPQRWKLQVGQKRHLMVDLVCRQGRTKFAVRVDPQRTTIYHPKKKFFLQRRRFFLNEEDMSSTKKIRPQRGRFVLNEEDVSSTKKILPQRGRSILNEEDFPQRRRFSST